VAVPTANERLGVFDQSAGAFSGTISDQFLADTLNGRAGCTAAINAAGGTTPAAGVDWSSIFPANASQTATIPTQCMDPVALDLLRFVPGSNRPDGTYQAVPTGAQNADQFTVRIDHHINARQNFSFYYYYTDEKNLSPFYNFQASGANIPGFGAKVGSRYQQYNPSHTWTISNSLVNEARFTYMREGQLTFQHPQMTGAVQDSCSSPAAQAVCFNGTSDSTTITGQLGTDPRYGITTGLSPSHTGVPFVDVSGGFAIGNGWEGELPQVGNSFMWSDSLTWVKGNHTAKFGVDVRRARFDQTLFYNVSGEFTFDGSTANDVSYSDNYPSYLLGLADSYTQGSGQRENIRTTGVYLFAQDSWKINPSLTLNYGLRWELDTPLTDVLHHVQTYRPGQNTTQYPCYLTGEEQSNFGTSSCADAGVLPTGLVVPGDKGVPAGMTQTYYNAFAPRIGVAYSPNFTNGALGKIFGANGKTSIRAGWGMFYNPMEQLVLEQFGAEPPFGGSTYLPSTFFNTPFIGQNGGVNPNPFQGILSPTPGTQTDWASFRPMLLYGDFQPKMRTQYTAQYNFTLQRELSRDLVLQLGYVGSQGHRLLASHDINASNPQSCLGIIALANTNPAWVTDGFGSQTTCGQYAEDDSFLISPAAVAPAGGLVIPYNGNGGGNPTVIPGGTSVGSVAPNGIFLPGLRPYSSPACNPMSGGGVGSGCPVDGISIFSNIFAEDTIAASAYNSVQASLEKRFSHGLQFQAAYTFSKSLDWASSFEETVNPFNYKASRALSLFNSAQRFVINYVWDLPTGKHNGFAGKVLDDWQLSGIIQFQSGFPIRMQTQDDNELISSLFFLGAAAPQLNGSFQKADPKQIQTFDTYNYGQVSGHYFFNADQSKFTDPTLGQFATTPRSLCCGPGENQWDITVSKRIAITESKYFQFRTDIFNLFNKTQFVNPDGNFSNSTFGQVLSARDPRLVQFALKFYF
jgi:hypothetical protein